MGLGIPPTDLGVERFPVDLLTASAGHRPGADGSAAAEMAILLSGLTYKKDNGYLYGVIDVSGVVHPQTQLNDA